MGQQGEVDRPVEKGCVGGTVAFDGHPECERWYAGACCGGGNC